MRIQTFPPRLMERVMARRAASICRDVTHDSVIAFNPKAPNANCVLRVATRLPLPRPLCHLRCLTLLGINIRPSFVGMKSDAPVGARFGVRRGLGCALSMWQPLLQSYR